MGTLTGNDVKTAVVSRFRPSYIHKPFTNLTELALLDVLHVRDAGL